MQQQIPSETIETFARTIFKEARQYGFRQLDLVRLVNELMDLGMTAGNSDANTGQRSQAQDVSRVVATGGEARLPLVGEDVCIRAMDEGADADLLRTWLSDKYGRYFLLSCATAQSATLETLIDGESNHLGIVTLPDGTPVGAMAYLDHNVAQKRAELRKLIGDPRARGQGLAEAATRLWIDYGVCGLGLEKIYVSTLQTHVRNIKLNESVGFRVEGLLRNEIRIDDRRHDVLRMGFAVE